MGSPVDVQATILEVLRTREAFGSDLIAEIEKRTHQKLRLAEGRVYPALKELERAGLLTSQVRNDFADGRRRIYYSLTPNGLRAAHERRKLVARLFLLPSCECHRSID
jgi:PadR family transcriptional regulator PadR